MLVLMSHYLVFIEPQKQWVKFLVTISYFKVLLKNVKGTWSLGFCWALYHNLLKKFKMTKINLFCAPGCPKADVLILIAGHLH